MTKTKYTSTKLVTVKCEMCGRMDDRRFARFGEVFLCYRCVAISLAEIPMGELPDDVKSADMAFVNICLSDENFASKCGCVCLDSNDNFIEDLHAMGCDCDCICPGCEDRGQREHDHEEFSPDKLEEWVENFIRQKFKAISTRGHGMFFMGRDYDTSWSMSKRYLQGAETEHFYAVDLNIFLKDKDSLLKLALHDYATWGDPDPHGFKPFQKKALAEVSWFSRFV